MKSTSATVASTVLLAAAVVHAGAGTLRGKSDAGRARSSNSAARLIRTALHDLATSNGLRFASDERYTGPHLKRFETFSGVARTAGSLKERLYYGKGKPPIGGGEIYSVIADGKFATFDKNGKECGPLADYTLPKWQQSPFVQFSDAFAFAHLSHLSMPSSRRVHGINVWRISESGTVTGPDPAYWSQYRDLRAELLIRKSDGRLLSIHSRAVLPARLGSYLRETNWLRISSYHTHVVVKLPKLCFAP